MALFDFDISHDFQEVKKPHEISADKGKTWTMKYLTPTEVLDHRMNGYVTRPVESTPVLTVYCLFDNSRFSPELIGIFSSREKAYNWLNKQRNGTNWTAAEIAMASIEPWTVDEE